jgi:hypothetical protein
VGTSPPHAVVHPHFHSDLGDAPSHRRSPSARLEPQLCPGLHPLAPPSLRPCAPPPGLYPRLQAHCCLSTGPLDPRLAAGSLTPGHRPSAPTLGPHEGKVWRPLSLSLVRSPATHLLLHTDDHHAQVSPPPHIIADFICWFSDSK